MIEDLSMPEPMSGCWLWLGSVDKDGYGLMKTDGKLRLAHRVAWKEAHGTYPARNVLHRCDTRCCVNPDHLYLGTQKDNVRDMVTRGRAGRPERKMTPEKMERLLRLRVQGMGTFKIAQEIGISRTHVRRLLAREKERITRIPCDAGSGPKYRSISRFP